MAMTKDDKIKIIDKLAEKFGNHSHFYITDATGLTVAQVNEFRRTCYKAGVEYGVYKNTLIKKALEKTEEGLKPGMNEVLQGFSGIIFSKEVANIPAKVMKEVRAKLNGRPILKAAFVEEELYVGDESLQALVELKSKDELIGDIIALLQSPAKNVISALQSGKQTVAGLVKALEDRPEKKN